MLMNFNSMRLWFWRIVEILCYVIIIAALVFCFLVFRWGREIHWLENGYVADSECLGNLGDFTAGTVGSLIAFLSVFLLYRTLRLQRIANYDNRRLLEVQRFNDLYFNLIGILDKITPKTQTIRKYRRAIENSVVSCSSFDSRKQKALECYNSIYLLNTALGSYFRTLYRILDLIKTSGLTEEEQVKYSKILRARFSIDELFLMRYDSLTAQGQKLRNYLWKY